MDFSKFQINIQELMQRNICPPEFKTLPIEEIKQGYLEFLNTKNLAYGTLREYCNAVRYFLLDKGLDNFTMEDINQFLITNVKDKNNYNFKSALSLFLEFIGCFTLKPYLTKIKMPGRQKEFTNIPIETLQKIINAMSSSKYRNIAKFQYVTGCRASEAFTTMIENIDYKSQKNIMIKPIFAKGDNIEDYMVMQRKHEAWLIKVINGRTHGFLFLDDMKFMPLWLRDKESFMHKIKSLISSYDNQLRKAGREYSINRFSSHWFRHLYSTFIFEKTGHNIYMTQKMLRHKDISSTMRYPIINKSEKDEILDIIADSA